MNQELRIKQSQQGVTLILAILLLASILSISFSLSTVLFIEVRNSADLIRTDSAFYGASGVAEQAIFNVRRHVVSPGYVSNFSNNSSMDSMPVVTSTTTPTFQDVVPAYSSFSTTANQYNFCNISAGSYGCGYSQLILTYLPTGNTDPLVVYLCEFYANQSYGGLPCSDQANNYYWISTATLTPSVDAGGSNAHGILVLPTTPSAQSTWNININKQQELILYTSSANPIYISLQTFDNAGNPTGLPLTGKSSVSVSVANGGVGRKIQVIVPNQ